MTSLSRELVFLILQFLDEEKFKESVHKLEQESGFFFNMKYFEEKALAGEWDEIERYLSGFTKVDDNRYSMKIFFEIRKQKYLEALDRHDRAKAVDILVKDLKVFSTFNEELYKEITQLLTLENFRENEQLSKYGDTKSARSIMLIELKKLIEANPLFREKLIFPTLKASRLRTLINQSLNWQHQLCKNPRSNPDIKTLFIDHTCSPPNGSRTPQSATVPLSAVPKPAPYMALGTHGTFPPAVAANANALAGWMANAAASSSVQSAAVAASPITVPQNQGLNHMSKNKNIYGDYQNSDPDQLMKRLRPIAHPVDESVWSSDDLPKTVACTVSQGANVTSMDFHPSHHTLLLVGSGNGEIVLWEIGLRERLVSKPFKIWDAAARSIAFQATLVKDSSISINKVAWSPDGSLIGIAFTKHLIHLYSYHAPNDLRNLLEIDAHVGGVNDIAFSHPNKQICIVTCGDDKLIKVWDLNGRKLFAFEGHEAPVYSVCPHHKDNIQFIFSTALDGKIKAWLYDNMGSRVDYDAPGRWCTTMLTIILMWNQQDGECFLVEWNESEGSIKRTYSGFRKKSNGVLQFDITQNHFLAVGEDNQIKFWDVDNVNMITSTDADGGLPNLPRLRFNKEGTLLAVSTADNGFKILANAEGLRTLRPLDNRSFEALKAQVDRLDGSSPARPSPLLLAEILEPSQCRVVSTTDSGSKVTRLLYTNSATGLLALGSNGVQRLWKWTRNEQNRVARHGHIAPEHWQPSSGLLMTNDVSDNDSYVMSACGGKVSLFNMMTFKVIRYDDVHAPPPASTFLAFHPQDNNIIAVKTKLKGHQKRITGLAFSNHLNILVSSGADAQLCIWSTDTWEKRKSISIQMTAGKSPGGDTRVQFHSDQVRLLVVHETQLAVYDASKAERLRQWLPQDSLPAPISSASYSCNSQLVYASFCNGDIGVFDADSLRPRCRIAPSAYLSPAVANSSQSVYPLVVATNPQEHNQLAVGLTDGAVKVIEPSESEKNWGAPVPNDNGAAGGRTPAPTVTTSP
ncbi:unnamed protein product [Spirodela intermedia]|uniref:CTLH domain-containing protein n=1 Tax=Spirodela intermedia TaxID=51605 RepID=A0A7I8IBD6_SPIIN|nr:unnamed protein product [Spirodela intermedia]CAA6654352.1 unnamed protein product [Spirodela intermedia]